MQTYLVVSCRILSVMMRVANSYFGALGIDLWRLCLLLLFRKKGLDSD